MYKQQNFPEPLAGKYGSAGNGLPGHHSGLPVILLLSSYPPRQCGIATFSQDLAAALTGKFSHSFRLEICALETAEEKHSYPPEVTHTLQTDNPASYRELMQSVNNNPAIAVVLLQHEFGLYHRHENELRDFIAGLNKPVLTVFHTVLPAPDPNLLIRVRELTALSAAVIVMTNNSRRLLVQDYGVAENRVAVIPHGTHLVPLKDKKLLKEKYGLSGRTILSTFGLLSSGKSIETTLSALPEIIRIYPDVLFLVIGKTHPTVVKREGEQYRKDLMDKTEELGLDSHVRYINSFLPLDELLDYLQLTDIYLFTSRDPNQAVSGTFSYAISCGCPVISTPIPHAREVIQGDGNIIFDFGNPLQLAAAIAGLLGDEVKRKRTGINGIHQTASTAWENTAISYALLFEKMCPDKIKLQYTIPAIRLDHIKKMTTAFGMIQFSQMNQPDITSGYTLDDNARALVAMCRHFEVTGDKADIPYIKIYFGFIRHCLQPEGHFLNYVREQRGFSGQNYEVNLADANGRAIWALGYLLSMQHLLPVQLVEEADNMMKNALVHLEKIHSSRAMAFVIKGFYYRHKGKKREENVFVIRALANRLLQMYRHERRDDWEWFESYLTYANSILPEAMLCAWLTTGDEVYRVTARRTFDFLLSKTFTNNHITVISNSNWLHQGRESERVLTGGEQPIDVAYTILALKKFALAFNDRGYREKMTGAFDWFLGRNHLHQIIYNPCTGGCYDGLEKNNVNLNQGAESTISYLLARLAFEPSPNGDDRNRVRKPAAMYRLPDILPQV